MGSLLIYNLHSAPIMSSSMQPNRINLTRIPHHLSNFSTFFMDGLRRLKVIKTRDVPSILLSFDRPMIVI